jgi:hypothetical protein
MGSKILHLHEAHLSVKSHLVALQLVEALTDLRFLVHALYSLPSLMR